MPSLAAGCLLATLFPLHAANTPLPAADAAAPVPAAHVTDEEDLLLKGELKPAAERRSRANALYAEAMLLPTDVDDARSRAADLLRQVVTLDPDFVDAQLKLAGIFLELGRLDDAYTQMQAVVKARPDSVSVQVELGYIQRLRGQDDDAGRICAKVLAADPTQQVAMRVILEIADEQGDLAGGVLRIEDILKAGMGAVPAAAWLTLDRLYLEFAHSSVNTSNADVVLRTRLPILEAAADKAPDDADTLGELARVELGLGQKTEALAVLRRSAEHHPGDAALLNQCAGLEIDLGRKADAIRDEERAYAANAALPGLVERLGGLYVEARRYAEAIALYQKGVAAAPDEAGLKIDLGIAYEASHHPEQAQACFEEVFHSLACPPEAYLQLAFFQLEHEELKQAAQTLASAQDRFPNSARVRFYEAVLHRYEKNYPAALAALEQARMLATGAEAGVVDQNFYIEQALSLDLAGRKPELEAALLEGLRRFPDDPDLMNQLAYFWAEQGSHLNDALELSRRAVALEPGDGAIVDTLGWVLVKRGEVKDALPYLQRAAVLTNNDPVVLQHVGDAYLKLGLTRDAVAAWRRALASDPHNADLIGRIHAAEAQANNVHLRSAPRP